MIRPGRLFWKLFAAFALATGTSFLVGASLVEVIKPNSTPLFRNFETPVRIARTIQDEGLDAALLQLRKDEPAGQVALFTRQGVWLAGNRSIDDSAPGMDVTSADGTRYELRVLPSNPFEPNQIFPLIIGALVSLFFSAGVAWYLARPLTHLSRGFRDVAAGRLATRLHRLVGARRDEIADLTREFDSMAAQLQQLLAAQERLLHDISHELRSPLARLHVAIGLLRQAPENLPDMLARVEREAERLDSLIEEILTLARLKSGTTELAVTRVDVIDLLTAIVDDANFEAQTKGCEVIFKPTGSFVTMAYGELLYRAYENVIRNAVKFAPVNSLIDVLAQVRDEVLEVQIVDRGFGIPPDILSEMFEPFKRADRAEEAGATGFGLGLAIAKHAVDRHSGTIAARPGPQGCGMIVEISIPKSAGDPG